MKRTEFIYGRYAKTKTEYILDKVKETLCSGKEAIVIVPEQQALYWDTLCTKEILPEHLDSIEIVSFTRLADSVFRKFGGIAKRHLNDSEKLLLMWNAIVSVSDKLKIYGTLDREDRYASVFLSAIAEMKLFSVTPEIMEKAALDIDENSTLHKKLHDLSLVYSVYSKMLGDNYSDPLDIYDTLSKKLEKYNYFDGKDVFIDSFFTLTPKEINVCEYILRQADNVYITLATDEHKNRSENNIGDNFVASYIRDLSACVYRSGREIENIVCADTRTGSLQYIFKYLWDYSVKDLDCDDSNITVIKCNDRYDEATLVAKRIKQLVNGGSKLSDIAVVCADLSPLVGITDMEIEKEGIPVYTASKSTLAKEPAFKFILYAIAVVASGWKKEHVIALSKTGFCNLTPDEADAFERYLNIWNISSKRTFMLDTWEMNPHGFSKLESYDEWGNTFVSLANSAKNKIAPLLEDFSNSFKGNVKDKCTAIFNLLCDFKVYESLCSESDALNLIGDRAGAQNTSQVWASICKVLDTICRISGDSRMDAKRLSSMLKKCADTCSIGTIPDGIEKVIIGPVTGMRLDGYKHIILLGASLGEFPSVPVDNGFFSEVDKEKLRDLGIALNDTLNSKTEEALFRFAYAAGAAEETLTVLIPSASKDVAPSMGAKALFRLFPSCETRILDFSGISGSKAMRHFAEMEHSFSASLCADNDFVESDIVSKLYEKAFVLSQSKIETFKSCPFKYYGQYILNLDEDREASVAENDIGSFVHYILEKFMKEASASRKFPLPVEEVDEICESFAKKYKEENGLDTLSKRSARYYDRATESTKIFAHNLNEEFAQSDFIPVGFETKLGFRDAPAPSLEIPLSDGHTMKTNGIVDRVDIMRKDNKVYVRVVDYKTGSKEFKLDNALEGHNFQMLLYLFSLCSMPDCELRREYAPNGEEITEAGVLYFSARPGQGKSGQRFSVDGEADSVNSISRTGILLENTDILEAMEKKLEGKYIPASLDKKGKISAGKNTLVSTEDFTDIKLKLTTALAGIGDDILSGNAKAEPDAKQDPCKYCKIRAVCRHENCAAKNDTEGEN